jgi:putative PIN family toxin of toxin-antitoxin system
MNRARVVLDTNVVVSAAINSGGLEARIVELVAARELTLYVSTAVIAEYDIVFARPKFAHIDPDRIARLLRLLKAEATMVTPLELVTESKDDPDNRFLECAEAAGADYLVTGNKRHFPNRWKSTRVVNTREFLHLVQ